MWQQVYNPFDNLYLSAFVAIIPIIFFFLALTIFKLKGIIASSLTLLIAIVLSVIVFTMPIKLAILTAFEGAIYGLLPISWIIITAVFLYNLSVKSGKFDIIRQSIVNLTSDRRIQTILIAFCFGGFLEGAAGFGAPVAITAALLIGLGFHPLAAAGFCLIANTAPVAFGALGIPVLIAAQSASLDADIIGMITSRQLVLLTAIVPFYLVFIMDGFKGIKEIWPAILVAAIPFTIVQYLTTHFIGYQLPGITSSLTSLICLSVFLQYWQPKSSGKLAFEKAMPFSEVSIKFQNYSIGEILKAWSPFLVLVIVMIIWTSSGFKSLFSKTGALSFLSFYIEIPGLHNQIMQSEVVANAKVLPAIIKIDLLSTTGTAIFISALLSLKIMQVSLKDAYLVLINTIKQLSISIFSIMIVLAYAYVTNKAGLMVAASLVLAGTGFLFPFFSPFLGWLGVFITGSDSSSNALFSSLQANTAQQIGISENITVAANNAGGVTGKMISPQSITIATGVVGMQGKESELFRFTVKHSFILVILVGIFVMMQAYFYDKGGILGAL